MNQQIENALAFDPLAQAEKMTGKDYKTSGVTANLGFLLHLSHSEEKAKLLKANKDTCYQNSLKENLDVIEDMGFRLLLCEDIEGTGDKFRIFWRDGVLISCDSYWGDKSINGGNAYFNFQGERHLMPPCTNGFAGENEGQDVYEGHLDIREGLRHNLTKMSEYGTLLPVWVKRPFLWLLSYQDSKTPDYDYDVINEARIAKLPVEVQSAIKGG